MENLKHTQGNWKVEKPHFNYYVTCNGKSIAQINASEEEEANARIIAASPRMYERLKELFNNYNHLFDKEDFFLTKELFKDIES
jgi:hypothetical protein